MTAFSTTFLIAYTEVLQKARLDATLDLAKSKQWVNLALMDAAVTSRYFKGSSAGSALSAAATSQTLPTTIVQLENATVAFGGSNIPLQPVSYTKLLYLRQPGGATGPPLVYTLRQSTVEFWPPASGGEIITYYGSTIPDSMSGDSDTCGLPEPFAFHLLTYGALINAAEFKADLLLMGEYTQQHQAWMGGFMAYCNRREALTGQAFEVYTGYPSSVPHDPSSDFFVRTGIPWVA